MTMWLMPFSEINLMLVFHLIYINFYFFGMYYVFVACSSIIPNLSIV